MKNPSTIVFCLLTALSACGPAAQQAVARDAPHPTRFASLLEATVPPARQLSEGERILSWIRAQQRNVFDRLDRARQTGNGPAGRCLDDRLTQLNALLRSAQGHHDRMQLAAAEHDEAAQAREFRALAIAGDDSDVVMATARSCRLTMAQAD
jgi:hypothetical protein